MSEESTGSQVARLLEQIRAEYEAAERGLNGSASGVSRHAFITKRMENVGSLHQQLQTVVGDDAIALIATALEQGGSTPGGVRPQEAQGGAS